MKTKPVILMIIALFQLLSPIASIVISAYLSGMSSLTYMNYQFHQHPIEFVLSYFLVQIAAAGAIFAVKNWSLPVCIGVTSYNIFASSNIFHHYSNPITVPVIVMSHLLNLGIIYYFLMPEVQQVYFNKYLRWWESKPRYRIKANGSFFSRLKAESCRVIDISKNGAFFEVSKAFDLEEIGTLEFTFENTTYHFKGKVAHKNNTDRNAADKLICGMRFFDLGSHSSSSLINLIKSLELNYKIERRPERVDQIQEIRNWFNRAINEGHGFVPHSEVANGAVHAPRISLKRIFARFLPAKNKESELSLASMGKITGKKVQETEKRKKAA